MRWLEPPPTVTRPLGSREELTEAVRLQIVDRYGNAASEAPDINWSVKGPRGAPGFKCEVKLVEDAKVCRSRAPAICAFC